MPTSIANQTKNIISRIISPHNFFPNNSKYPLLIYKSVFDVNNLAFSGLKKLLKQNLWNNAWLNGIYDYDHYHSNTHEALIVISGTCNVSYGGSDKIIYTISEGDVIIHPAGVSHKKIYSTDNFSCVGAYPDSINYDMYYGKKTDHPQVDLNIEQVPLPKKDPVYGENGILYQYWK